MTTYILPKTLDFTYCSDVEDEETFVQLPNNSTPKPVNKVTHCNLQMKADMADDYSKTSCFEIRKSLEMKKPSNNSPAKSNKSICDNDTQCDTSDSDSEGEIFNISEEDLKISQENYQIVVERSYALVREAKESKFRGFFSPTLLRDKLYDIMRQKRTHLNPDSFFTEYDFSTENTIRDGFESQSETTIKRYSQIFESNRRMRNKNMRN